MSDKKYELVYVYIKDYKVIKKQGFNFSPDVWVEYKPEENLLKISKRKETSSSLFKHNITVIVGQNGVGKSTLFEYICGLHLINQYQYANSYRCIIFDGEFYHILGFCNTNLEDTDKIKCRKPPTKHIPLYHNITFNIHVVLREVGPKNWRKSIYLPMAPGTSCRAMYFVWS